jgi:plasmid replication initiation protein
MRTSKLQENNLVAQANSLINARYKTTKHEHALLVAMISLINPNDKEFHLFNVTVKELSEILKIHEKVALVEFDKITDRLLGRIMRVLTPDGRYRKFQWVSESEVSADRKFVSLRFHHRLKPYLLNLKENGNFTQYRLGQILMFKSFYTSRMYGILVENYAKKTYKIEYPLDDFRKAMLGETATSYPLYKNFRNKVIDTAQKELSVKDKTTGLYKSDLGFDLETRRTGRNISHLIFIIKTQQTKPIPTHEPKRTTKNSNTPQIILDYEAFGVMQKMIKPYLDQRGEQALQNTLNKFHDDKENGKITKSEQGYLAYLLRVNAGQETTQEKERQQTKQNQQLLKEKAAQEQALKIQFEQERDTVLNTFFASVPDEELEYIIANFETSELFKIHINASLVLSDMYKTQGMEDQAIKNCFNAFIIDQYLDSILNDFAKWKEKNAKG